MIQCSKMVNFYCTEAGVEFRQQFNGAIRTQNQPKCIVRRCTTSGDVAEKFGTHTNTQAATGQNDLYSEVALAKNSVV